MYSEETHSLYESAISTTKASISVILILINALCGNLTRFAFGPYLMKAHEEVVWAHPHEDDPLVQPSDRTVGQIRLPESESDNAEPAKESKLKGAIKKARRFLTVALNPPLIGGLLALFFGIIPWLHQQLFTTAGWLTPIADSIANVGNLCTSSLSRSSSVLDLTDSPPDTALQMFVCAQQTSLPQSG
ncbi:hypothetical protein P7C70_g1885, partial [Phenoliferia sp. Uapishka_3]